MSVEFVEELKKQWMAMIDAIDDPLVLIDSNYNILRQNRAFVAQAHASNRSIKEFKGAKCYELFVGRKSPCTHCLVGRGKVARKAEDGPLQWSTRDLFPDRQMNVRVHELGAAGSDTLYVVHYHDATEEHMMQESLARADKLAALGKLAGGVAHEINSPLAGILAFSQMALKEMEESDPHRPDLVEIEEAAKKCKVIVEGLLGFARQDKPTDMKDCDVFEAVRSTLRLSSAILKKHHIELHTHFEPESAFIYGNSGKLGQVFLNLVTNAIYVMKEGGTLAVSGVVADGNIVVRVQDSGPGIDPAVVGKIFDPFFTTKPVGEGTGLGLSIAYSIIKQHQGSIKVASTPNIGTTFEVSLPMRGDSH